MMVMVRSGQAACAALKVKRAAATTTATDSLHQIDRVPNDGFLDMRIPRRRATARIFYLERMVVESLRTRQHSRRSIWLALAASLFAQETPAGVGYDHLCAASGSRFAFHQSAVYGVFPYREARA